MNKFIAVTALYTLGMTLGILTMIHGWGLEAKSWWWIIGVGIIIKIIIETMNIISKEK